MIMFWKISTIYFTFIKPIRVASLRYGTELTVIKICKNAYSQYQYHYVPHPHYIIIFYIFQFGAHCPAYGDESDEIKTC